MRPSHLSKGAFRGRSLTGCPYSIERQGDRDGGHQIPPSQVSSSHLRRRLADARPQCVRLSRFENDRTISFIPPDGEFELMSYRINTTVKPLIWAEAHVEVHSNSRVEYMVKVKAQFKRRSTANNVEVYVPVPDDASSPRFRASIGSVHYVPEKSAFVWKLKQLGGGKEYLMRAQFGLPSVRPDEGMVDKRTPITIKFEVPYFSSSSSLLARRFLWVLMMFDCSRQWHSGAVPQDRRKERLPSPPLGPVHHTTRPSPSPLTPSLSL